MVSSYMKLSARGVYWDFIFKRPVQDWELEAVQNLFEVLYFVLLGRREEDIPYPKKKRGRDVLGAEYEGSLRFTQFI